MLGKYARGFLTLGGPPRRRGCTRLERSVRLDPWTGLGTNFERISVTTPSGESAGTQGQRAVLGLRSFSEDVSGACGLQGPRGDGSCGQVFWVSRASHGSSPHRFGTPKRGRGHTSPPLSFLLVTIPSPSSPCPFRPHSWAKVWFLLLARGRQRDSHSTVAISLCTPRGCTRGRWRYQEQVAKGPSTALRVAPGATSSRSL